MEIVTFSSKYNNEVRKVVVDILDSEFGHVNVERLDLDNISRTYQSDEKSNFWIALEDDKVIGTIALLKYKNFNFGVLKRFAVKKDYRRKGVGKKLMETLIEFAKSKKLNSIIL